MIIHCDKPYFIKYNKQENNLTSISSSLHYEKCLFTHHSMVKYYCNNKMNNLLNKYKLINVFPKFDRGSQRSGEDHKHWEVGSKFSARQ